MITIDRRQIYEEMKHELSLASDMLLFQCYLDNQESDQAYELYSEHGAFVFEFEEAFRLEDEEKEVSRTFEEWFRLAQALVA